MKSHRKFLQPPFQRKPVNAYATERKKGQETKTKNKKPKNFKAKQTKKQQKTIFPVENIRTFGCL